MNKKMYAYYRDGRKIAILQLKEEEYHDPRIILGERFFCTPTSDDSEAILLRYSVKATVPVDETDDLGLSRNLSNAVVCYLRAKLLEDSGDINGHNYYMNKFHSMVQKEVSVRSGTKLKQIIPQGSGILK